QQQQTGVMGGAGVVVGPSGDGVDGVEYDSNARCELIPGTTKRGNSGEASRVPEFGAVMLEHPVDDFTWSSMQTWPDGPTNLKRWKVSHKSSNKRMTFEAREESLGESQAERALEFFPRQVAEGMGP
ncbi:hypothetical protein BC830DRAFT_1086532, partial [Chytriomyces sp. MP71]